ncbi:MULTISPECIES: alpha/beta fold hydrolase [Halomonadaceae]|uniref:2-succinyl-6-hydroxy-2, 4-cyclohexadiene-1-carboxylate synthase n=2 Tax=root TaxID=1 RepID=A0AAP9NMN6_9GAMM|nr:MULTISPECIES: alpha/beta hydrolase [Halomonas]QKS24566.1 2-succinyl-6-hydroxy-2,4-cyclohexadiene-1-carboxylate synthase [Halomonas titanicae]CDG54169.1 Alpha/beta hydrolase [Halomonas sp. A3H3]SDJ18714.1 Lysophospholipase, alpha-beta hydrolase superfamily [Halomonas titanicae]|tara:strand:- start:292 stop:1245 length:954 start_codon:yes stop_codon:yes gene_type:complete
MQQRMLIFAMGVLLAMSTETSANGLDFEALVSEQGAVSQLPSLLRFDARDGTALSYRHYPSDSPTALVLLHGSGTDSKYLATFAQALADAGAAAVYTPDVRGHGPSPQRRGDIDYINQLEDDLADFIYHIKAENSAISSIVVGGHSSGGGLAIRFAGGEYGHLASAYLLLAPYLGHDAPTVRNNSGGWAEPSVAKIIALSLLNRLGVTSLNGSTVLRFNLPAEYRNGSETLAYSYRLMTGFNPSNYRDDLRSINVPSLILTGAADEAFFADRFESTVRPHVPDAAVVTVPDTSHLGLLVSEDGIEAACHWLQTFGKF